MELITRQTLAGEIVAQARQTWPQFRAGPRAHLYVIEEALSQLADPPDPNDVDRLTGSPYRTRVPECGECGTGGHTVVIRVGQEPDHESYTAYLCRACVAKAFALFPNQ